MDNLWREVWTELGKLFPQLNEMRGVRRCVLTLEVGKAPSLEIEQIALVDGGKAQQLQVRQFGLVEMGTHRCAMQAVEGEPPPPLGILVNVPVQEVSSITYVDASGQEQKLGDTWRDRPPML